RTQRYRLVGRASTYTWVLAMQSPKARAVQNAVVVHSIRGRDMNPCPCCSWSMQQSGVHFEVYCTALEVSNTPLRVLLNVGNYAVNLCKRSTLSRPSSLFQPISLTSDPRQSFGSSRKVFLSSIT
ncbi:unnamed protein product, partial [Ectocarpus sp. 12 AP-2014]